MKNGDNTVQNNHSSAIDRILTKEDAYFSQASHATLITLYQHAANSATNEDERAFFLTQAYILALEEGDPCASQCHKALIVLGREQ